MHGHTAGQPRQGRNRIEDRSRKMQRNDSAFDNDDPTRKALPQPVRETGSLYRSPAAAKPRMM